MEILQREYLLDDITRVAKQLLLLEPSNKIFLLEGPMGAGKTTLIKEMSKALGSEDNFSSPTFSIVNDYSFPGGKIHHFDLYRIKNEEELFDIGFEEYIHSGNYCFIEWPQLSLDFLKKDYLSVNITVEKDKRTIQVMKY